MERYFNFGNIMSGRKCTVNGETIEVPSGASVSIINGRVYIDGKEHKNEELKDKEIVQIVINGNVGKVESDCNVEVNGNVTKCITSDMNVTVNGDVQGDIYADMNVTVGGDQTGNIKSDMNINIGRKVFK